MVAMINIDFNHAGNGSGIKYVITAGQNISIKFDDGARLELSTNQLERIYSDYLKDLGLKSELEALRRVRETRERMAAELGGN
jgi:hypothetical protein